jgi:hypothetical protein
MTERLHNDEPAIGEVFTVGEDTYRMGENHRVEIYVPDQIASLLPAYAPSAQSPGELSITLKYKGPGTLDDITGFSRQNPVLARAVNNGVDYPAMTSYIDQNNPLLYEPPAEVVNSSTSIQAPAETRTQEPPIEIHKVHYNRGNRKVVIISALIAMGIVGSVAMTANGADAMKLCLSQGLPSVDAAANCEVSQYFAVFGVPNTSLPKVEKK